MALVECPECKKEMSDKAVVCPHCGAPNVVIQNSPATEESNGRMIIISIVVVLFFIVSISLCGKSENSKSASLNENLANKVDPESNQAMAALINLNGCLCAQVTSVRHVSGDTYFVDCIEMRNGSGTTHYSVDLGTGKAFKRF